MRKKLACMAVFAVAVGANVASANPFTDIAALPTFYTDATMKTMKPMAGFKKAWFSLSTHDRAKMTKACDDPAMRKPHAQFCANVLALGGAN
ncbi:MAG: hypothetical protein EOR68_02065 [Mesorhizobium sp.]|uniref:hypothetical protein n=1 Tax=Mesorhizobium sp. TaxID=1871066 RepID=UPI000FE684F1|nr:hypothetical protein [Mesorhizobium sp.]RWL84256.1 MAG: hypothetical protein EOR69_08515 [Mesorhizobium sp.]RWL88736.1 MAG: hypothetical protein EOR67_12355 [Mesorhizobium sp.]RWM03390.1 MAG: hypothetical protein EOR70_03480 [Mesorhizobium sp.]RWM04893.1 MAG: hypothetical protein EOR68_02065 [Mesorhizobium sp.]TJV72738.1 MAG: hypothetical protein E5X76_09035 [Mesorhizobium sp.]